MGFLRNIKESINDKSTFNVDAIALLTSAFVGLIVGVTVCFVMIYDVLYDGMLSSDVSELSWMLIASGIYITGSGIPKTIVDSKIKKKISIIEAEQDEDIEDMRAKRRKRREKSSDDNLEPQEE